MRVEIRDFHHGEKMNAMVMEIVDVQTCDIHTVDNGLIAMVRRVEIRDGAKTSVKHVESCGPLWGDKTIAMAMRSVKIRDTHDAHDGDMTVATMMRIESYLMNTIHGYVLAKIAKTADRDDDQDDDHGSRTRAKWLVCLPAEIGKLTRSDLVCCNDCILFLGLGRTSYPRWNVMYCSSSTMTMMAYLEFD